MTNQGLCNSCGQQDYRYSCPKLPKLLIELLKDSLAQWEIPPRKFKIQVFRCFALMKKFQHISNPPLTLKSF